MFPTLTWLKGSINNRDTLISSFEFLDALDTPYSLKITCHGSKNANLPIAFDSVTFTFKTQKISGLLMSVSCHEDTQKQRWDYVLEIRPRLYILALSRSIQLYPNQSISAIMLNLLAKAQSALGTHKLPYTNLIADALFTTAFKRLEISYAPSDLEYLQTLMQYGIRFCFEEGEDEEQLILLDAACKLPRHKSPLSFAPDKKEDLYEDLPTLYKIKQKKISVPSTAAASFYDPENVKASLAQMMQSSAAPNNQVNHSCGNYLLYQAPCYSPPVLSANMNGRINQLIHASEHHYELYSYYSGLRAGQQINMEGIEGFIEQVKLSGIFAHEAWRFDSVAELRSLQDKSWLGTLKPRAPSPATLTGAEISADEQVNDLGEFKVKFPERFVTDANNEPWVSLRDLQNTSTAQGGASHSMSGNAEVLIASENGQAYHWMILGSLDNNERPNIVKSDNYRESRMSTTGGVNVHLRRQDASNPYSEINMNMMDNQNNPAGLNLGTKLSTMQDDSGQHGIQEISSGYAKRSIMGNYYDTVGDPENPVHQLALTQDTTSGLTSLNQQTNVSQGGQYLKSYYTEAIGAQNISKNSASKSAEMSDEFKLFVATVYGEAVGQGPIAWKAVASVIMNRVQGPDWKKLTTVTEVIQYKHSFQCYEEKSPQFTKAANYLNSAANINSPPKKLSELIQVITPIYKKIMKPITDAIYYYSPNSHNIIPPYIIKGLAHSILEEVFINGVSPNAFKFFKKIK